MLTVGATPPTASDPDQLAAELPQYRHNRAQHQIQVKVANSSSSVVTVDRFSLLLPGFEVAGAAEPATELAAGHRVDLPVDYGPAICDAGDPVPATGTPQMALWLDGAADPVTIQAQDAGGLLGRLAAQECATRAVTDALPMAFDPTLISAGSGSAPVTTGVLHLGPVTGGQPVRVEGLDGTTLLAITTTGLPLQLSVGDTLDLMVQVMPQRCDPHAVIESSRGYLFRVLAGLQGRPSVLVPVPPGDRAVLAADVQEYCGF